MDVFIHEVTEKICDKTLIYKIQEVIFSYAKISLDADIFPHASKIPATSSATQTTALLKQSWKVSIKLSSLYNERQHW